MCELALRASNAQALQCVGWWSASNSNAVLLGALAAPPNRMGNIDNRKGSPPAGVHSQPPAATPSAPPIRFEKKEINHATASIAASAAKQGSPVVHHATIVPVQAAAGTEAPAAAMTSPDTARAISRTVTVDVGSGRDRGSGSDRGRGSERGSSRTHCSPQAGNRNRGERTPRLTSRLVHFRSFLIILLHSVLNPLHSCPVLVSFLSASSPNF